MMMSFSGYSFCKPHSASYARVSFQAAYLKAHFQAEFMPSVLSNQGGFYSSFAYAPEARLLGLTIIHPDVNCSRVHWQGNSTELRVGLMAVTGLASANGCAMSTDVRLPLREQHPITLFTAIRYKTGALTAQLLHLPDQAMQQHRRSKFLGWLNTGKIVGTKKGEPMEFLVSRMKPV